MPYEETRKRVAKILELREQSKQTHLYAPVKWLCDTVLQLLDTLEMTRQCRTCDGWGDLAIGDKPQKCPTCKGTKFDR
jgi:predicted Zn-ribbon and HTH transcriptional regulator